MIYLMPLFTPPPERHQSLPRGNVGIVQLAQAKGSSEPQLLQGPAQDDPFAAGLHNSAGAPIDNVQRREARNPNLVCRCHLSRSSDWFGTRLIAGTKSGKFAVPLGLRSDGANHVLPA